MKKMYVYWMIMFGVVVSGGNAMATSILPSWYHGLPVGSAWETDYIPGKGSYFLKVVSESELSVTHDRNSCGFDRLGNVSICTMMAFPSEQGEAFYENIATDKRTSVLGIQGTKYNVVVKIGSFSPLNKELRLLVLNGQDNVVESLTLSQRH